MPVNLSAFHFSEHHEFPVVLTQPHLRLYIILAMARNFQHGTPEIQQHSQSQPTLKPHNR